MAPVAFPLPVPGDIVYCRFPHAVLGEPGPKPRPALVTAIARMDDGTAAVEVAYGTSQRVDRLFPGEFAIVPEDGEPFRVSGLSYPTKFDLRRRVTLPYNDTWFKVPARPLFGRTPKMGSLHASLMKRAVAAHRAV